jgi:hypothetical protein
VKTGCWDSIHVIEAVENDSRTSATYKLTTTVMLHMGVDRPELGDTVLSGSLTRQVRANVIRVGGSAYMRPGSSRLHFLLFVTLCSVGAQCLVLGVLGDVGETSNIPSPKTLQAPHHLLVVRCMRRCPVGLCAFQAVTCLLLFLRRAKPPRSPT